ncbi:MAG TPA: DUF5679 domain-containing protein [Candidatus Dojkabacteria bacterium]|nr:DUF5679 domain-containing protein [Candidatus Dojkabacteria bacterium]
MSGKKKNVSMFCVKCKEMTATTNAKVVQTKNNRYRLTGNCTICGTNKSKFVSSQTANGLLGSLLGLPGGKVPILSSIPLVGDLLF